jgi:hypothetical protein
MKAKYKQTIERMNLAPRENISAIPLQDYYMLSSFFFIMQAHRNNNARVNM